MRIQYSIFFLLLFLLTGCSVFNKIYTDYDRTVDFTKYKTFAWLPGKDTSNTPYNNQVIRNNTINYFTHCMAFRGMKANVDTPDVLLLLVVTSIQKQTTITKPLSPIAPADFSLNPYYYPYPNAYYYYSPYEYNYSYRSVMYEIDYTESTITLNVIDRKLNKLVWVGSAQGDLYDPEYLQENLHPAVYNILKNYPTKSLTKHKRPQN